MATLYEDLEFRGLIKQVTDPELKTALSTRKITLYCGFDPTSDCLHIGHLLPLLTLRRFQLAGHKPIAVAGGATGMIGDPSGKSAERSLLGPEQIAHNIKGIRKILERFLEFSSTNAAIIANNGEWFGGMSFIAFLRDVGKHFTVNHMMAKESVRARLEDREHGISYTEFSYMLLQAYDFYHLHRTQGCELQIGGSDQWGNITAGTELIRRMHADEGGAEKPAWGLTLPLVMKSDGTKFGKTERGAIWLDASRTSPYQFYQFLIQTDDRDVITYLKYFTFLPHEEIRRLEGAVSTSPEKREAQTALARELTRLVHGQDELDRAESATQALFGSAIRELDERTLLDVMSEAPSVTRPRSLLEAAGYPLIDAVVDAGLCPSKGQARKDIAAGGVYLNNERATDAAKMLTSRDLIAGGHLVLRKGKKNYALVRFE